jgi:maltose/moltooligosaccharide transporter
MPYAILVDSLPPDRSGIYMGIFNLFIVLPEIFASLSFGWVMNNILDNNRLLAVVIGGGFLIIAALLMQRVQEEASEEEMPDIELAEETTVKT